LQGAKDAAREGGHQERAARHWDQPDRVPLYPLLAALQVPCQQQAPVSGLPGVRLQSLQPLQQEGARMGMRPLPHVQVSWRNILILTSRYNNLHAKIC
jgi:hypothetical protein